MTAIVSVRNDGVVMCSDYPMHGESTRCLRFCCLLTKSISPADFTIHILRFMQAGVILKKRGAGRFSTTGPFELHSPRMAFRGPDRQSLPPAPTRVASSLLLSAGLLRKMGSPGPMRKGNPFIAKSPTKASPVSSRTLTDPME